MGKNKYDAEFFAEEMFRAYNLPLGSCPSHAALVCVQHLGLIPQVQGSPFRKTNMG